MGFFDSVKKVASGVSDFMGSPLGQFTGKLAGDFLNLAFANKNTNSINQQNADLQREFAQNSIQWRVQDAKNAGIHPLYALGASTISAQPSFVGNNAGIDFGSAFNFLTQDKKYERAIKEQTLLKNDMELKRLALENAQLQKGLEQMGQTAVPRNRSQVAVKPNSNFNATASATPRFVPTKVGDNIYVDPNQDSAYADVYSEGVGEKLKHLSRFISDSSYKNNLTSETETQAKSARALKKWEWLNPKILFNGFIPEPGFEIMDGNKSAARVKYINDAWARGKVQNYKRTREYEEYYKKRFGVYPKSYHRPVKDKF